MRIDTFLFEKGIYPSRTKASEAVKKGLVLYKNKPIKTSLDVSSLDDITILQTKHNFVSNGGYKLQKAIDDFNFDPIGLVFADIGASNGGFTDCLLKHNAKKIYAIDVGESQLDTSLLNEKVVVLDNTNARFLDKEILGELVDGVVCDVSFISLKLIIPSINKILKDNGVALLLIKPQFECGKEYLGNSGIVKSKQVRHTVCENIYNYAVQNDLYPVDITTAPIRPKKNVEYIIKLTKKESELIDITKFKQKLQLLNEV